MGLDQSTIREIDRIFAPWDRDDSPGVALAVLQNGEVTYARGYGLANLEYGLPITPDTVFHVASVSKQFTAMAVMLLVQDGLLDLQADIHAYLPELPDFGHRITLGHLLHHTSGLRDQWELLIAAGWRMDDVITREQILKLVQRQRGLNFLPGEEYLYSNTGFTLAAEIVSRVSGQSFRQFCAEHIFAPLGMQQTHFHDDHEEIVPNRAYSYAPKPNGGWRKSVLSYATVGATSLFTTARDLAKWLQNFDRGEVGGAEALRRMQTTDTLSSGKSTEYGLGLMLTSYRGLQEVGHSGADAGFRAWCGRFPQRELGLVVLTNAACFVPRDLARQVAAVLLPELAAPPDPACLPNPKDFVGEYFPVSDNSPVAIRQVEGRLLLTLPGQKAARLEPSDQDVWNCPGLDVRVVGQRDAAGAVNAVAIQSPRMNRLVRRRRAYAVLPEQLRQYRGDYYCEELDTHYRLLVENGRLLARHQRHSDLPLLPVGSDAFVGDNWRAVEIQFARDDDGCVIGLRWSGSRVRDLWFARS